MQLHQPVKPFTLTQKFGENKACVTLDGTNKVITCDGNNPPPGYKSLYGKKGHLAIDIAARHGQEVFAPHDGTVYMIDTNPKSGLDVRLEWEEDGTKWRCICEHLMGYQVKVGDTVKAGQLIAWADNTGYSSGDHLHFVLYKWDGAAFVPVDPMPYMSNLFAPNALRMYSQLLYLKESVARLLELAANRIRK